MNAVLWNLVLAVVWMLISGNFSFANFVLGVVLGATVLFVTQSVAGLPHYTRRAWKTAVLVLFTAVELVRANFRVARDVLLSQDRMVPAVVDLPLDVQTDVEITLLALLITLTPGSTPIDISEDRKMMYVHLTNVSGGGVEQARRELKDGFERRIMEVMR